MLIIFLYEQITRFERVDRWLKSLSSEKTRERINRWGMWFVLLGTPYAGIWLMSLAAKTLGMNSRIFLVTSFISIFAHALVILVAIRAGVSAFGG
ncbi:MAG: hypothetical protein AAFV98_17325 [Chloroflexota bacterium]